MNNKRIQEIVDFLYSSDDSEDVPLRVSVETGQFTGFSLSKEAFKELLIIFNDSVNLKTDLENFRSKYEG